MVAVCRISDRSLFRTAAGQVQYRRAAARRVSRPSDPGLRAVFRLLVPDDRADRVDFLSRRARRAERGFFSPFGLRYANVFVEIQVIGLARESTQIRFSDYFRFIDCDFAIGRSGRNNSRLYRDFHHSGDRFEKNV